VISVEREHSRQSCGVESKVHENTAENPMSLPAEITGREPPAGDGSALDALIDFYRAFNASDLKALAANRADGEAPSMDNPIGGIRRGWPAIGPGSAARPVQRGSR
jgi:hypothetical protein